MGRLVYSSITSLDGYVADVEGNFDWSAPDAEVHAFVNEQERGVGTQLLGRRLYQVLAAWETFGTGPEDSPEIREYGEIWRATDKIVFSGTLSQVGTARTRIEPRFDPLLVGQLKHGSEGDLSIGGPTLAAAALRAGLVDEVSLYLSPVVVGGGTPALPDGCRLDLRLTEERRFGNGVVFLRYQVDG